MILALAAAIILQAAGPQHPQGATSPPALTIRAGTPIRFVTEGPIDSRSVRQGQRFAIVVAEDVRDGDRILIPKGIPAVGEVESVTEKGMFGKSGGFVLRPLFIELNGTRINLEGATETSGKEQLGGAAVATILTGGLGLIITGKSAQLPAGSPLLGTVRSDARVASHR